MFSSLSFVLLEISVCSLGVFNFLFKFWIEVQPLQQSLIQDLKSLGKVKNGQSMKLTSQSIVIIQLYWYVAFKNLNIMQKLEMNMPCLWLLPTADAVFVPYPVLVRLRVLPDPLVAVAVHWPHRVCIRRWGRGSEGWSSVLKISKTRNTTPWKPLLGNQC